MYKLSALELAEAFKKGNFSAEEICKYFLARIDSHDEGVGAFLRLYRARALKRARELDEKRASGATLGKLAGVPVAIKDNIHVKGELTTCASKFLENYKAHFDSTVVEHIEKHDGIVIGKTNLDEFAMGSGTEYSAFQGTTNPWNAKRSPGGSSGGSAAAVSARFAPLSLGSDTGGSIRQPAAFTGTVGFKPTYGRVSRYGLVAFGSSFDCIGPFANSVADIALMMEVIGHHCPLDSTSIPMAGEPYLDLMDTSLQGKKIGVPYKFLEQLSDSERAQFDASLEEGRKLGLEIVPITLDNLAHSVSLYYILAPAEASTNLARFDGVSFSKRSDSAATVDDMYDNSKEEGFGPEVKQRILLGTYVLSSGFQDAFYKKASKVRRLLVDEFHAAFKECDMIAMPTAPGPAFEIGSIKDPVQMYLQDVFTIGANLAGLPAISLPSGLDSGLPVGFQLIGPLAEDARVLRFASHFEKAFNFAGKIPENFNRELAK